MAIRPPATHRSSASVGCGTARGTNAAARKMAEPRMVPAVMAVTSHNPSALTRPRDSGSSTAAGARVDPKARAACIGALYLIRSALSRPAVTIAVLPFENLTGDPDRQYLVDGLAEETIATLGQLDPSR